MYINYENATLYTYIIDDISNRFEDFKCTSDGKFKYTFPMVKCIGTNVLKLNKNSLNKVTINMNPRWIGN